jgi:zinc D-Ala-D-Ala carboxypeptidase
LNKAGFSGEPHNSLGEPSDDIPAALRDTPDVAPKLRLQRLILLIGGLGAFVLVAVISGFVFSLTTPKKTADSQPSPTSSAGTPTQKHQSRN